MDNEDRARAAMRYVGDRIAAVTLPSLERLGLDRPTAVSALFAAIVREVVADLGIEETADRLRNVADEVERLEPGRDVRPGILQ